MRETQLVSKATYLAETYPSLLFDDGTGMTKNEFNYFGDVYIEAAEIFVN